MAKKLKITILTDKTSWMNRYNLDLADELENLGHSVNLIQTKEELTSGDIAFFLSYFEIIKQEKLKLNKNNIVVHASALPEGKGWSPMSWQILEGKNEIPITLFEAISKTDSGDIYLQDKISLNGTELIDEWQKSLSEKILEMCLHYVNNYGKLSPKTQKGQDFFYSKRTDKDSELDISRTIQDQFNLLRIVDNEKYPAFFDLKGQRYKLKIEKYNQKQLPEIDKNLSKINDSFKFKRLLFLGATNYQLPAIKKAKELGCIVITASSDLSEIGHVYSDLSLDISTTDRDKILEVAKEYKIDAIMTYASNASVEAVSYVSEKLNLPGNNLLAAEVLQDKGRFRRFQMEQNLPHPNFVILDRLDSTPKIEKIKELLYKSPLISKPTDSGGSKGQGVLKDISQLKTLFNEALDISYCKNVIFEEKLDATVLELDGDVFFQDEELYFSFYGHNYFKKDSPFNVPVGEIFPGKIDDWIRKELDRQFSIIIKGLKLNAGCMNFDALVCGDKVIIVDIALRNGGNFVPEMIKASSGFDMTEASIYAAFGKRYEYTQTQKITPVVSYILSSRDEGTFVDYTIKPSMYEKMIFSQLFVDVGDRVGIYSTGGKALGVVSFKFDTLDEAMEFANNVDDYVQVNINKSNQAIGTIGFRTSQFLDYELSKARKSGAKKCQDVLLKQFYMNNGIEDNCESEDIGDFSVKHYEADLCYEVNGKKIHGLERLYKRQLVIEPILQCLANCRHCLRQNYAPFALEGEDMKLILQALSDSNELGEVRELLITGGDPLLVPIKLRAFLDLLAKSNTKVEIVRIASRLPIHNPYAINDIVLALFSKKYPFKIEFATQINHTCELFDKVKEAYAKIRQHVNIYNQTVLLKGINDSFEDLTELCDSLRYLGIENHYIFHCVPMKEASTFRTNIDDSLKLIRNLTSCGEFSGRAKPQFTFMTDIGKITLYEGTIIDREDDKVLLQSNYKLEDRLKWNPNWELPPNASVDENGLLRVWYKDKIND